MNRHIRRNMSGETTGLSMGNRYCCCIHQGMRRLGRVTLLLCLPVSVLAQQGDTSPTAETEPEEMVIRGDSPLHQIRAQMLSAEEQVYELFNQLNDEARFNVTCDIHQPTGTRFREQACLPRFVRDATRDHGRHYWETYRTFLDPHTPNEGVYYTHAPMQTQIASQQEAFRDKMREVARDNPAFLEALARHSRLVEHYKAETGRNED